MKKEKQKPEDIAVIYWQESRQSELVSLCLEMLKKDEYKDSSFWLKYLSDSYCFLAKWNDALEVSKKRTALFPEEHETWDILVLSYAVLGDYKNAAAALKEAEEKMNWNISYNEPALDEEPGMSAEFYNGGKEGVPSSFTGTYWRKYAMYTLYPVILKKAPKCAAGWYTLAKFYGESLCYYDKALKAIEKSVELKPDWKPSLAYHAQILSYLCKDAFEEEEIKVLSAKTQEAYKKWNKEKALKRKQKEDKEKKLKKRLTLCETKNDYQGILDVCGEALADKTDIELTIDPFWLYYQTEAYKNLERWKDAEKTSKKRLEYAKKRRDLYARYEDGDITSEESSAFHFLDGKQSELSNFAWNSAYRLLDNEEKDCKETLQLVKKRLR